MLKIGAWAVIVGMVEIAAAFGAGGVTAAVMGAYIVLCPTSRVLTWIFRRCR